MPPQGFFSLQSADDLIEKARYDFARLKSRPTDALSAFNFFVTARHVPDWLYSDRITEQDALFAQFTELRICRHLAEGAKHFVATDPKLTEVLDVVEREGPFDNAIFDATIFDVGALTVELAASEAKQLGINCSETVIALAELVMLRLDSLHSNAQVHP